MKLEISVFESIFKNQAYLVNNRYSIYEVL